MTAIEMAQKYGLSEMVCNELIALQAEWEEVQGAISKVQEATDELRKARHLRKHTFFGDVASEVITFDFAGRRIGVEKLIARVYKILEKDFVDIWQRQQNMLVSSVPGTLESILQTLGETSFADYTNHERPEKFREVWRKRLSKGVEVKGSCVELFHLTLKACYSGPHNSRNQNWVDARWADFSLTWFDRGRVDADKRIFRGAVSGESFDYDFEYPTKIEKVKFFKNGKISLKFKKPELAQEFYDTFFADASK